MTTSSTAMTSAQALRSRYVQDTEDFMACIHLYKSSSRLLAHTPAPMSQARKINVNAFGDDYVSFSPMHLSFSPDGRHLLMSTGETRVSPEVHVYECYMLCTLLQIGTV